MSKPLTKNARWVVLWARYQSADNTMFLPKETVCNTGRHHYDKPAIEAIQESVDFTGERILASQIYEVDVQIYPYAKQHKEVTKLAEEYFRKRRIVT